MQKHLARNWSGRRLNFLVGYLNRQGRIAAPTQLVANGGASAIALTWNAVSGAASYNVYRGTSSGGESSLATGVATNSYSDSSGSAGTIYYYKVTAVDAQSNESAKSNEAVAVFGTRSLDFSKPTLNSEYFVAPSPMRP